MLDARTSHTITDPKALLAELAEVAARGWASNLQEGEIGVSSVGAPIRGADGAVIAAVTVSPSLSVAFSSVPRLMAMSFSSLPAG